MTTNFEPLTDLLENYTQTISACFKVRPQCARNMLEYFARDECRSFQLQQCLENYVESEMTTVQFVSLMNHLNSSFASNTVSDGGSSSFDPNSQCSATNNMGRAKQHCQKADPTCFEAFKPNPFTFMEQSDWLNRAGVTGSELFHDFLTAPTLVDPCENFHLENDVSNMCTLFGDVINPVDTIAGQLDRIRVTESFNGAESDAMANDSVTRIESGIGTQLEHVQIEAEPNQMVEQLVRSDAACSSSLVPELTWIRRKTPPLILLMDHSVWFQIRLIIVNQIKLNSMKLLFKKTGRRFKFLIMVILPKKSTR